MYFPAKFEARFTYTYIKWYNNDTMSIYLSGKYQASCIIVNAGCADETQCHDDCLTESGPAGACRVSTRCSSLCDWFTNFVWKPDLRCKTYLTWQSQQEKCIVPFQSAHGNIRRPVPLCKIPRPWRSDWGKHCRTCRFGTRCSETRQGGSLHPILPLQVALKLRHHCINKQLARFTSATTHLCMRRTMRLNGLWSVRWTQT